MFGLFSGVMVNIALGEKAYNIGGLLGGLIVTKFDPRTCISLSKKAN